MRKPGLWLILILFFTWQILDFFKLTNAVLFPSPWQWILTLQEIQNEYLQAFLQTLSHVLMSFALSTVLGILIALFLSLKKVFRDAFLPLAMFFQTVPIIAIAPLLVIYFGYGSQTILAAATLVSLFPVIANTLIALTSTPLEELELFQINAASTWQILIYLRMPRAYLGVYSGLRIAAGLAVIGVVAGEFVAGGGLGSLIDSARTQQRIDIVFAALGGLSFIGWSLVTALAGLNTWIQKWRPLALDLKL